MNIVLLSTYEMGRQPFGLASPHAWLTREGHRVFSADLSLDALPMTEIREAGMVAFYLPMHTATRLAIPVIEQVKRLNPGARVVCYGLYAPLNQELLRSLGVDAVAGGEFEPLLAALAAGVDGPALAFDKLAFAIPDRSGLPAPARYAKLQWGGQAIPAAYTEASRGCKHLCRHCPVVPVYQGQFRVVAREVVLEDIRRQIAAGARHVTFGDPDFWNGPGHAMKIVEQLHAEFSEATFDATIKIEHLRRHRDLLKPLKQAGCLFVTSAVESVDDEVLAKLEKNHTRGDFVEVVEWMKEAGLALAPTFIAFSPWTTLEGYRELLQAILDLELVEHTAPVQLALRLLVTPGSRLLELEDIKEWVGPFDPASLVYPWKHRDPSVDALAARIFSLVASSTGESRTQVFSRVWELAHDMAPPENFRLIPRAAIPYMDEPWYC